MTRVETRLPFDEVRSTLAAILARNGFAVERARACACLFAETTRDGVYSHGVNRFPRFIATIRNGSVDPAAEPLRIAGFGALERWDGCRGPGNLNASASMNRATVLAHDHGIGCVALGNTNHWMRGGTYGWQAAEEGLIALCFTNTMPNLPPWGGAEAAIGNNPLILAIPRQGGHIVLDMAMSQFSYGALESYRMRGELLPVLGGFDIEGNLTRDPGAIEQSLRPLPIGYWKGSGLSILLDTIAATLSLGRATHQLAPDPLRETGMSQVFIAIHPGGLGAAPAQIAEEIVASIHSCPPVQPGIPVRYPGEQTLRTRAENLRLGLPIDSAVWEQILAL